MKHNLVLPLSMQPALERALNEFSADGFLYDIEMIVKGRHLFCYINASEQECVNLGIKIGRALDEPDQVCKQRIALLKDNQQNLDMGAITREQYEAKIKEIQG